MSKAAPRVRVGSAAACAWSADTAAASSSLSSDSACGDARLIGVFAGHVVTYEQAQPRLLVRQAAHTAAAESTAAEDTDAMELPEDVTFAAYQDGNAPFVLMWSHVHAPRDEDEAAKRNVQRPMTVYVADAQTRSLMKIPVRDLLESNAASREFRIQDGVIDCSGQHVVLMDSARSRLSCWTSPQKLKSTAFSPHVAEWTQCRLASDDERATIPEETSALCVAAGRFTRTSLLGHCFTLVRASWDPSDAAAVRIHKWVFDVEMDWKQIEHSTTRLSVRALDSSTKPLEIMTIQLRMNSKWTHGTLAIGSTLIEFKVDFAAISASSTTHSSLVLEQKIVDTAWVCEHNTLAILLDQGQVAFASRSASGSFELLIAETQSTTSMQLDLTTLLNRDGTPASRVGTHTRVDEELRSHFEQSVSPSAVALLEIARLALFESTSDFQDVFFTLVSIIFQQRRSGLQSAEVDEDSDLRLLETILSLIFSEESHTLHKIASKMLLAPPAFPSRGDRRLYYRNEMDELVRFRQQLMTGIVRERHRSVDQSQRAFLSIYLPSIASLLEALLLKNTSCGDAPLRMKSSFTSYQRIVDDQSDTVLQEAQQALTRISQVYPTSGASLCNLEAATRDSLLLIFVSHAMVCSNLRVDGVHMDLWHVLSVAQLRQHKPLKREQLACFATSYTSHFKGSYCPDSTASSTTPVCNLEIALEFARATQTMDLLVAFCSASKSLLAHECLKEICVLQAKHFLNSKNLLFEKRVGVTRQFKALHLQICESYIGEMVGLLREVPLVLQFKHAIKGRDALQSEAFGSSKDVVLQGFESFTRHILTGTDSTDGDLLALKRPSNSNSSSNRLWKRSSRETRVQARCLRLKSSIVWHLKQLASCDEQNLVQIFERIFLIAFLSGRCGNTEEAKLVAKFVDKAQDAVSCDQWQQKRLSFDNYQQLFSKTQGYQSHYRVDKVVRSLALLVWAIWIRERCACCLRSIELLKGHELPLHKGDRYTNDLERKSLGSLAAMCALQLNVLGILVEKPDDIFALQISLLEEAAKLNPEKTVAVICWAFPADKIQARYLKRYKALRQLLKADSGLAADAPPIEETEHRCQFIQRHVKRSIRWSITSGSMKPGSAYVESPKKKLEVSRSWTVEIDVLVDCCCDLDFQKVTWALIQKKFAGGSRVSQQQNGGEAGADAEDINISSQLKKVLLQSRSATTDGAISRKEVMLLLQEQKRELEGKVRSWSIATTTTTSGFQQPKATGETEATGSLMTQLQEQRMPSSFDRAPTDMKSTETSFAVCDIDPDEREARTSLNRMRKQSQQIERRESVQNVLKLLNLRKQRGGLTDQRSESSPNLLNRSGALRSQSQRVVVATGGTVPAETDGVPSPKRHARGSGWYQVTSSAPFSETQDSNHMRISHGHSSISISPPLVFPLTHSVSVDSNSYMKLLNRTSGGHSMLLKTRQFSFQQRASPSKQNVDECVKAWDGSMKCNQYTGEEVVSLKSVGAQTDNAPREEKLAEVVKVGATGDQSVTPTYVSNDAATQSERNRDAIEAGVQCTFKRSESANLETFSNAGSDRILNKFPVFVDLAPSSTRTHDAPKKFLQIARFSTASVGHIRDSEADNVIIITPEKTSHTAQPSKNEANKSLPSAQDDVQQLRTSTEAVDTNSNRRQNLAELMIAHQTRYRNHFAVSESSGKPEQQQPQKRSISTDRSSLIGLKEDMERLKTRLAQLEHCADEINEDFKDSHHQLDRIEKEHDSHERTAMTHLLEIIDDTVEEVNDSDEDLDPFPSITSVLSTKASKDIGAAKKLIETIEQITLDDEDE